MLILLFAWGCLLSDKFHLPNNPVFPHGGFEFPVRVAPADEIDYNCAELGQEKERPRVPLQGMGERLWTLVQNHLWEARARAP